jgi:hypothetical protein
MGTPASSPSRLYTALEKIQDDSPLLTKATRTMEAQTELLGRNKSFCLIWAVLINSRITLAFHCLDAKNIDTTIWDWWKKQIRLLISKGLRGLGWKAGFCPRGPPIYPAQGLCRNQKKHGRAVLWGKTEVWGRTLGMISPWRVIYI